MPPAARLPADRSVPVPAEPPPLRQERGTGRRGGGAHPAFTAASAAPPGGAAPAAGGHRDRGGGCRGHRGCTARCSEHACCPRSLGTGPLSHKRCSETSCHRQEKLLGRLTSGRSLPCRLECPHVHPSSLPPQPVPPCTGTGRTAPNASGTRKCLSP